MNAKTQKTSKTSKTRKTKAKQKTYALMLMAHPPSFKRYSISRTARILETDLVEYYEDDEFYRHHFVILEVDVEHTESTFPQTYNYKLVYNPDTRPWTPCIASTYGDLIHIMSGLSYFPALAPMVRDERLRILIEDN